ncbi:unnamed protein product [Trichobilharzia regenti]|nr:unnamed protein product [Trichobilharzia regenti]
MIRMLARRNSTKGPPSILVSNPRISRNAPPAMDTNAGPFRRVFYKIGDFFAGLVGRKASSTVTFCATASPSVVDLTGEGSQKDGLNVVRAPVYQDLRLTPTGNRTKLTSTFCCTTQIDDKGLCSSLSDSLKPRLQSFNSLFNECRSC